MLEKKRVIKIIKSALKEDIGNVGDVTTDILVAKHKKIRADIKSNEDCILCGMKVAEWVFNTVDDRLLFKPMKSDGDKIRKGQIMAYIEGRAASLLTAERLALNFLSILSGTSTRTGMYAEKIKRYGTELLDTRKTIPLLRYLQKYAVFVGGGKNHRMNLSEMVMIKDNHLKVAGNTIDILYLRRKLGKNIKIEIETENIASFKKIISLRPDIIMLDNMKPEQVRKAVCLRDSENLKGIVLLEASGGITIHNIEDYAKTGVDAVSIGNLTDTISGVDFSMSLV